MINALLKNGLEVTINMEDLELTSKEGILAWRFSPEAALDQLYLWPWARERIGILLLSFVFFNEEVRYLILLFFYFVMIIYISYKQMKNAMLSIWLLETE